ncbi:TPA: T9SS type A sorting domain-containing protein [Candidatus Poribacteria bacterium]|nr:T9SS type A sorting domain-containing protein [Candidatus Poribacteria bacterium]
MSSGSTTQNAGRIRTLVDSELDLDVLLRGVSGMRAFSFDLSYDSNVFEVLSDSDERPVFEEGTMLESETSSAYTISRNLSSANTLGMVNIASALIGKESSPDSSGTLGRLKLKANAVGGSQVTLRNLILIDNDGRAFAVPDVQYEIISHQKVEDTRLLQNYPNPFNPETWIPFELNQDSNVSLAIYDTAGRLVRHLDLGFQPAGTYLQRDRAIYWDGRTQSGEQVASSTYFYTLKTEDYVSTQKMIILK